MMIRGTVFLDRREMIIKKFGEDQWKDFYGKVVKKEPFFGNPISPISLIPMEQFEFFESLLLQTFFDNDATQYWLIGEESAKYALQDGPYQIYTKNRNLKSFIEAYLPILTYTFFNGIKMKTRYENNIIHIKISRIPIYNNFLEYLIMGYIKGSLMIMGIYSMQLKKITGLSDTNDEIYYQIAVIDYYGLD